MCVEYICEQEKGELENQFLWKNIDDEIWLIGSYKSETTIAASSYLEYIHGEITGRPPKINLQDEKLCQSFLRNSILESFVVSSHDISDGGLAVALAECCILSKKGANIELNKDQNRYDNLLFAEGNAIKYICRHKSKGKAKDIEKAIHYLEMILERDYS